MGFLIFPYLRTKEENTFKKKSFKVNIIVTGLFLKILLLSLRQKSTFLILDKAMRLQETMCQSFTKDSDSEMSNFDGDDSVDEHVSDKIVERINDDFVETDDESKNIPMEYPMEETTPKNKTHNYRWRKKPPPEFDITFKGEEFSLPPEGADEMTPLNYFKIFWSNDIINC